LRDFWLRDFVIAEIAQFASPVTKLPITKSPNLQRLAMFRRLLSLLSVAALGSLAVPAVPAHAQESQQDNGAPAYVAYIDGSATLEREGRSETSPLNMPLMSGDRLRTDDGRAEVLFDDGSALHLDERTTIDVQSDDLLRLIDGRIRLNLVGPSRQVDYRIDSPAGSVRISQNGEYRIALLHAERETQLELAVVRGAGEIFTDQGTTPVRAGERAYASEGLAPSYPYTFNSANWDEFDRWSEMRRDTRLGVSSQYLPTSMQTYAPVFDQYGDWRYAQSYGYVWYPRVAASWRPYYYGRWMSYPRHGWTWVGTDFFAWPTHHYGRWGFSAGAWFWIPGYRWAPAYVSWAYAPGYVSWCPLGFNNLPVIAINLNFGSHYYSPWHAWTVVGVNHFHGGFVSQHPVFVDHFDARHRPVFVTRPAPPAFRDVAVPRNSTPIRWAGARPPAPPSARGATAASVAGRDIARPRDNYFTRGGDNGEHVVAPAAPSATRNALPGPSRPSRDIATLPAPRTYQGGRSTNASGERALPRTSQAPATAPQQRTAPEGPVRRSEPRAGDNSVYAPRDLRGATPRLDRRAAPGRLDTPRQVAPGPGGGDALPPFMNRGDMAVPRGMPSESRPSISSPGYQRPSPGGPGAPGRAAPSQSAPAPQRSAPAERSRPSGGQSSGQATARRGRG
jgi:hypothetical protein